MKILYTILGLLVAFLLFDMVRMYFLLRKSKQIIAQSRKFERIVPNPSHKILVTGDSTAVGTGSAPEYSVAGRFGKLYPNATIKNDGVNGRKIHELAAHMETKEPEKNDLTIVQIGGNDILQFTSTRTIAHNLEKVLKAAAESSKTVVILHSGNVGLAPAFPRYLGWLWTLKTKKVRRLYMDAARRYGAHYIDLYQDREDDIFLKDPDLYYAGDYMHPSEEGYKWWFEKIKEKID